MSAVAVHHASGDLVEQLALDEVGAPSEDHSGLLNVPQSDGAGTFEGAAAPDRLKYQVDPGVVDLVLSEDRTEFGATVQCQDQRQ